MVLYLEEKTTEVSRVCYTNNELHHQTVQVNHKNSNSKNGDFGVYYETHEVDGIITLVKVENLQHGNYTIYVDKAPEITETFDVHVDGKFLPY